MNPDEKNNVEKQKLEIIVIPNPPRIMEIPLSQYPSGQQDEEIRLTTTPDNNPDDIIRNEDRQEGVGAPTPRITDPASHDALRGPDFINSSTTGSERLNTAQAAPAPEETSIPSQALTLFRNYQILRERPVAEQGAPQANPAPETQLLASELADVFRRTGRNKKPAPPKK